MKSHFAKSKVHLAVAVLVSTLSYGQAAYGQAAAPVPPAVTSERPDVPAGFTFTLPPPPVFVPPTLVVPTTPPPAEPVLTPMPAEPVLLPMPAHPGPTPVVPAAPVESAPPVVSVGNPMGHLTQRWSSQGAGVFFAGVDAATNAVDAFIAALPAAGYTAFYHTDPAHRALRGDFINPSAPPPNVIIGNFQYGVGDITRPFMPTPVATGEGGFNVIFSRETLLAAEALAAGAQSVDLYGQSTSAIFLPSHAADDYTIGSPSTGTMRGILITPQGAFNVTANQPGHGVNWRIEGRAEAIFFQPLVRNIDVIDTSHVNFEAWRQHAITLQPAIQAHLAGLAAVREHEALVQTWSNETTRISTENSLRQQQHWSEFMAWQQANAPAMAEFHAAMQAYWMESERVRQQNQILHSQAQAEFQRRLAEYPLQVANSLAEAMQVLALSQSVGGGAALADRSFAAGAGSIAQAAGSTAVGNRAWARGENASAFGENAIAYGAQSAAFGSQAVAAGAQSTAVGAQAQAVGERSTAIGAQAAAVGNDSIALGTQATAFQGIAIGTRAISESVSSVAIGQGARAVSSVAVGTQALAAGVRSVAVGDGATAIGASAVALGDGATATGASAVALGAGTVAERDGTVSVGGRQIVGVADGTQPGDAVTVRQLESALAAASGSQISEKIDGLRSDMQSTERRVSAGVAMALAMSQPVSIAPGDSSAFTAAAGNFNGQSALAIGVHHTPIPGLLYSAGLGITTGSSSPAIRVGFSLSF